MYNPIHSKWFNMCTILNIHFENAVRWRSEPSVLVVGDQASTQPSLRGVPEASPAGAGCERLSSGI